MHILYKVVNSALHVLIDELNQSYFNKLYGEYEAVCQTCLEQVDAIKVCLSEKSTKIESYSASITIIYTLYKDIPVIPLVLQVKTVDGSIWNINTCSCQKVK